MRSGSARAPRWPQARRVALAAGLLLAGCRADRLAGVAPDGANACELLGLTTTPRPRSAGTRTVLSFDDVTADAGLDRRFGRTVALGDVNADGRPDLLVPGDDGAPEVFLNCAAPDGTLRLTPLDLGARRTGRAAPQLGRAAQILDLDADGRGDLVLAGERNVVAFFQQDGLRFEGRTLWSTGTGGAQVSSVVPFLDAVDQVAPHLYVARRSSGPGAPDSDVPEAANLVLLNDGAGTFRDASDEPAWQPLRELGRRESYAFAQFAAPPGSPRAETLVWIVNDAGRSSARRLTLGSRADGTPATFGPELLRDDTTPRTAMGIAAWLADGRVQMVVAESAKSPHFAWDGADGLAPAPTGEPSITPAQNLWGTAAADFDADGFFDVAMGAGLTGVTEAERREQSASFANSSIDSHLVLLAGGPGPFRDVSGTAGRLFDGSVRNDVYGLAPGDLDGDGCVDLVAAPLLLGGGYGFTPAAYDVPITILRNPCDFPGTPFAVRVDERLPGALLASVTVALDDGAALTQPVQAFSGVASGRLRDVTFGLGAREPRAVSVTFPDGTVARRSGPFHALPVVIGAGDVVPSP